MKLARTKYWAARAFARGKNERENSIELRDGRGKKGAIANNKRNEKQNNEDHGWSSVVHGLGPVHQRSFLGTNPCALETPILTRI